MPQKTEDLDAVYGATTPEAQRALYDDWSDSYDADNIAKGFWLPQVGAGLFARHFGTGDGAILDAGCGTGLVGQTLRLMGYEGITGCDLSPEMLARAGTTGAYETLTEADMGAGLPFGDGAFAGFTCIGAFGPGHAPPQSLQHLARVTRKGGIGVFNLVEATQADQGFPPMIAWLTDSRVLRVVQETRPFRAYLLKEPDLLVRGYVVEIL